MSFKSALAGLATALLISVSPVAASETEKKPYEANPAATMFNMFDASAWKATGSEMKPGTVVPFHPADPKSWANFADPKMHNKMHMAFTNPAQYAQFMQPQFFMQFMNPNMWMAWANPASYKVFMDPATMAYWMQPGAYMHVMNPAGYMQGANPAAYAPFMNPGLYMSWMNPAAYTQPVASGTSSGNAPAFNFFDPAAWSKAFQPQAAKPATEEADKKEG